MLLWLQEIFCYLTFFSWRASSPTSYSLRTVFSLFHFMMTDLCLCSFFFPSFFFFFFYFTCTFLLHHCDSNKTAEDKVLLPSKNRSRQKSLDKPEGKNMQLFHCCASVWAYKEYNRDGYYQHVLGLKRLSFVSNSTMWSWHMSLQLLAVMEKKMDCIGRIPCTDLYPSLLILCMMSYFLYLFTP